MTKLCPRGKAAAKRKFAVYPSAYANAYASKICAGKIKDPSGLKRKDFKGPKKAMGGSNKEKLYQHSAWQKEDQLQPQVVEWLIRQDERKHNFSFKEVIMLDSIKSKWNNLNKKGKMIVVVIGVVAIYAISQIV